MLSIKSYILDFLHGAGEILLCLAAKGLPGFTFSLRNFRSVATNHSDLEYRPKSGASWIRILVITFYFILIQSLRGLTQFILMQ